MWPPSSAVQFVAFLVSWVAFFHRFDLTASAPFLALPPPRPPAKKLFKSWKDSGFCKRNRWLPSRAKHCDFALLPSTLAVNGGAITADIESPSAGTLLTLELRLYADNHVHFVLDEKHPLRPRYRVSDVVVGTPKLASK